MGEVKTPAKLLVIITGLGQGGAENHLLKILPKIDIPYSIVSLTPQKEIGEELAKKGAKITYLNFKPSTVFSTIQQLKNLIKKEQPTIIDSYLIHANILARIVKPKRIRLINSVRGDYFNRNDYQGALIIKPLERITRKKVDLWVPNSESLRKILIEQKIPSTKITVLPNCVDVEELTKKSKENIIWPFSKKDKVICYVGSLRPVKNIPVILRALAILPEEYKVLLIGDGPQKKELEKLAKELQVTERVTFLGKIKNPAPYLKKVEVFVLPSFSEGMSNALLEAMALEVPCVVSDIAQNRELCENTFETTNAQDLVKNLQKKQKNTIKRKYTLSVTTEKYSRLIQNA
jgi:glycosyltransferase involved in cell wall biosynthesis